MKDNNSLASFGRLVKIMRDDTVINRKVVELLQLNLYQRRNVLNNWLEQLRAQNAPLNLQKALACLFDEKIAKEVLTFIKKHT